MSTVAQAHEYRLKQEGGVWAICQDSEPWLTVGTTDRAHQWAAWYTDVVSRREVPAHPPIGLEVFDSADAMLFVYNGLPVGTIGWNGQEWWWFYMDHWGSTFGSPDHVEVDRKSRLEFNDEWARNELKPDHIKEVLHAEWRGRLQLYREETYSMARLYGMVKAKPRGKALVRHGIDHTCTGYLDESNEEVAHMDEDCPIHTQCGNCLRLGHTVVDCYYP